ncbi:hypothetical protein LOV73_004075 [Salmonella enterica]|nr:hypothetical protein [Salmonella enterica]
MMKEIQHQKQGEMDCVCTCIAMVSGVKRKDIRAKYHDRYMNDPDFNVNNILDDLNIKYRECHKNEDVLLGKVYIVTVPSINMLGYFHQIIIDARINKSKPEIKIFDPNKGVRERKYYVFTVSGKARNQVKLLSYILDYEILDF